MSEPNTNEAVSTPTTETAPAVPATAAPVNVSRDAVMARAIAALERNESASREDAEPAAEAAPTTEEVPASEPAKETKPPAELESDRWARLNKLEAERRAEKERLESEYAEKQRALEASSKNVEKFARAAELLSKGKPHDALAAMGMSYEELTAAYMRGDRAEEQVKSPIEQKLEALEAAITKQQEAAQEKEHQATRERIVAQVQMEVPKETFPELTRLKGWEDEVLEAVRLEWERDGFRGAVPPVTFAEMAQRLEDYLSEETYERAKSSPKARERLLRELGTTTATRQEQTTTHAAQASAARTGTNGGPPRTLTAQDAGTVTRQGDSADPAACRARAKAVAEQLLR